jgi:hypothetical protein
MEDIAKKNKNAHFEQRPLNGNREVTHEGNLSSKDVH